MSYPHLFDQNDIRRIKKGLILFNMELYWECHEELEHHWRELSNENIKFVYWAILQVAVSVYHYKNANLIGAKGLIIKAQNKLDKCEALNLENSLMETFLDWGNLKRLIREVPKNCQLDDFKALNEFRFKSVRNI
jgi:hypothetical protein